ADEIMHLRLERLPLPVEPGVPGHVLPIHEHRLRIPVPQLPGQKIPRSSSRILFPDPASAYASARPGPNNDPVIMLSHDSLLLPSQRSSDSSSAASTSYSSAVATLGAAETTRPSPATGAIASSTSAISSLVAPAASARAVLHCRQTADDPSATDTATCSRPTVLPSRAAGPSGRGPSAVPASPSSKIASLRRVSWNLAVWLMLLHCHPAFSSPRAAAVAIPRMGLIRASSFQQAQFAGPCDRLGPAGGVQLPVDGLHLRLDRVRGQEQFGGDFRNGQVGGEQGKQAEFGRGQCRRARNARPMLLRKPGPERLDLSDQSAQAGPAPEHLIDLPHERPG